MMLCELNFQKLFYYLSFTTAVKAQRFKPGSRVLYFAGENEVDVGTVGQALTAQDGTWR